MKFSEKLQKLRKENNLSQEQLADKLDVSRQSVSKWESGQTYPEMDKLLTMCKLFNITLDDLTNDEINWGGVKPKNKNTFDNLVDDVMYIIDKTYCMFTNMEPKERGKCISELVILFLVLLCFRLPFEYLISIGESVIYHLPRGAYMLESLWSFMINIVYLILFIFTFIYIYKTYFLDKYKEKNITEVNNDKPKEEQESEDETKPKIIEEAKETKKHVKEKREKTHNFGTTLFEILGRIISVCFKAFLTIVSFPFIISFIALVICVFVLIVLLFKGIFYLGFITIGIAAILLNWILLKLIASFLFGFKPKFNYLFTSFIIGLALVGIGTGISIFDIINTEIYDDAPKTKLEYVTKTYEYDSDLNLVIDTYTYHNNITYTVDENVTDKYKIEISYYKDLTYIDSYENTTDKYYIVEFWGEGRYNKKIINLFFEDLKDKRIYDYGKLYEYEINIISSNDNLEKLKNTANERRKYKNDYYLDSEIRSYRNEINSLYENNNDLQNKLNEQNNKIENLQIENENLKNKIKEYKENLENIFD